MQVVGTILPAFHAPDWILQLFVALTAVGFPVALILSWVFEIEAGGLRKTVTPETARPTNHRRIAILGIVGLLLAGIALTGYWLWHPWRKSPASLSESDSLAGRKSIAVIPFTNLSDDKENAYFTQGVQDEILTDLAKVSSLKVISRTSVMQYRAGAERNLREIGQALGATYILEGTVQREGQRVRVSAQLIDARADGHLWAEHYDRDIKDLFALQSELAETIVTRLESTLSPREKAAIEATPTADLAAHDLYLRANALISQPLFNAQGTENLFRAVDFLDRAVRQDPNYFLAYCRLASAHDQIYFNGTDQSAARLQLADSALQSAQRLRPDAGETHLARAEHLYCGFLAYDDARRELGLAQVTLPNEPLIYALAGFMDRRQSRWENSMKNLTHALELDPRNTYFLQQIAVNYYLLHQYDEAARYLDLALPILPNDAGLRLIRAETELAQRADTRALHLAISTIIAADPNAGAGFADEWLFLALCERDPAAARRATGTLSAKGYTNEGIVFPRAWCEALVARLEGDDRAARAAFTSAREQVARSLSEGPDHSKTLSVLAMIDAALGRKAEAISEGRQAVEQLPLSKDSINGALVAQYLAVTYAWVGEKDAALEQLRTLVGVPSELSYGQLRLHPFWDSLRADPQFEKIVDSLAPPATSPQ